MDLSQQRPYWPTIAWKELSPQEVGMDQALLEQMRMYIDTQIPGLQSLLIARHGYLVFEQYFQGSSRDGDHYIASATKSIISALVGIALEQGVLQHLDQSLADVFPAFILSHIEPGRKTMFLPNTWPSRRASAMRVDGLLVFLTDISGGSPTMAHTQLFSQQELEAR